MGIEPTLLAWKAKVLPLNYTRFHLSFTAMVYSTKPCIYEDTKFNDFLFVIIQEVNTRYGGGGRIRTSEG